MARSITICLSSFKTRRIILYKKNWILIAQGFWNAFQNGKSLIYEVFELTIYSKWNSWFQINALEYSLIFNWLLKLFHHDWFPNILSIHNLPSCKICVHWMLLLEVLKIVLTVVKGGRVMSEFKNSYVLIW